MKPFAAVILACAFISLASCAPAEDRPQGGITFTKQVSLRPTTSPSAFKLTPSGDRLIVACEDEINNDDLFKGLLIYDLPGGKLQSKWGKVVKIRDWSNVVRYDRPDLGKYVFHSIAISSDQKTFAIAASDAISVWDFKGRTRRFVHEEDGALYDVALSSDGALLAGACRWTARVWDLKTQREVWQKEMPGIVTQIAFSKDTPYLVFATMLTFPAQVSQGWIHIRDGKTFESVTDVQPVVRSGKFALSDNGGILAYPDGKKSISDPLRYLRIYDIKKKKQINLIGPLNSQITAVCLSHNGGTAFVGTLDGEISAWDTATAKLLGKVKKHRESIRDLSLNQDGTVLASYSWEDEVMVWKIKRE